MDTRERRIEDSERGGSAAFAAGALGNIPSLRELAQGLLSAGDKAIERALSKDQEAFLRAVRQTGGQ